ncbi:hypothetical protein Droror1_Dr00015137, partial [Drosera rotundifolia]
MAGAENGEDGVNGITSRLLRGKQDNDPIGDYANGDVVGASVEARRLFYHGCSCVQHFRCRRGSFAYGCAVCYVVWIYFSAQEEIMSDLSLSTEFSLFGSMITVGAFICAISGGKLSDFVGQKGLMICLGISTMFFCGTAISWCVLGLIGIAPLVVQFLCLSFIPESPRYLAKIGRAEECEAVLQRLRGENVDISLEAADIE